MMNSTITKGPDGRTTVTTGELVSVFRDSENAAYQIAHWQEAFLRLTYDNAILALKCRIVDHLPFCPDHRDKVAGKPCRECEIERLTAIVQAAWEVRREEKDYNQCPDLALRANARQRLHKVLDTWKAANATGEIDGTRT